MNRIQIVAAVSAVFAATAGHALEPWQEALERMPLPAAAAPLSRSNCIPVLLGAFQSNAVVQGLVVLPGVSDDFYLLNRDRPLNLPAGNLWEAVEALPARSQVRVTFHAPFVFLHTKRDKLDPDSTSFSGAMVKRLRSQTNAPAVRLNDRHWDSVQPWLSRSLGVKITPSAGSIDAWHFARHNLATYNLSDWDLLCAISLTGGTSFTVNKDRIQFREREPAL